jgi:hypothetical protein
MAGDGRKAVETIPTLLVGLLALAFVILGCVMAFQPTTLTSTAPCPAVAAADSGMAAGSQTPPAPSVCTTTTQAHNEATVRMLFGLSAALGLAVLLGDRLTHIKMPGLELTASPPITERDVQKALLNVDLDATPSALVADEASAARETDLPVATLTTSLGGKTVLVFDDISDVPHPYLTAWKDKLPRSLRPMQDFLFAARRNEPGEHPWLIVTKAGARWRIAHEGGAYTASELPPQA